MAFVTVLKRTSVVRSLLIVGFLSAVLLIILEGAANAQNAENPMDVVGSGQAAEADRGGSQFDTDKQILQELDRMRTRIAELETQL
ncbi:MAG TPA: hypothetical protein VLL05_07715, partial [Terriglobales bacterium]|nr:hypothetical protein [Terriglobales bacterium]